MKYVSIDIETTGLDPKRNQIVEIGAVLDEIGSTTPIEDLPKFRAVIIHGEMQMGAYCADLHHALWLEINKIQNSPHKVRRTFSYIPVVKLDDEGDYIFPSSKEAGLKENGWTHYCLPEMFEELLYKWLCLHIGGQYISHHVQHGISSPIKINVAGKNPGSFDIPFIEALPEWRGLVDLRRRVLDPASHFVQESDEHIPDLQTCLDRAGIVSTVSHTAVDDAIDVVKLVRLINKYQNPIKYCTTCANSRTCTLNAEDRKIPCASREECSEFGSGYSTIA